MSSGPTPANQSVETGTPPREWLDPALVSTPDSTPSKDIPGNFPETPPTQEVSKQLEGQPRSDNQSKMATDVDKPSVSASVGSTFQSIKKTVSSYWSPEEHKEDPHVSLPSTESQGAQPSEHSGGVGALPGNVSESGVAVLPEDKEDPHVSLPSSELKGAQPSEHSGGVGALPGNISESSVAILPEDKEDPHVSLPSSELKGAQPSEHTGGVGALPGNISESSVALLPEEREYINEEDRVISTRQRGDTIKPSGSAGNDEPREPEKEAKIPPDTSASKNRPDASQQLDISGTNVESQKELNKRENQEEVDQGKAIDVADSGAAGAGATTGAAEPGARERPKLPSQEVDPGKNTSQDKLTGGKEGRTTSTEKSGGGYGGDYHPAQLHPPPSGAGAAEHQSTISDEAALDSPTMTGTKGESAGPEKKSKFITMVKGEMKVLAGKVSGDERKVQEGKKLVHGEA